MFVGFFVYGLPRPRDALIPNVDTAALQRLRIHLDTKAWATALARVLLDVELNMFYIIVDEALTADIE